MNSRSIKVGGYVDLLAAFSRPATAVKAAVEAGYCRMQGARVARRFHKYGLVHVADWDRPTGRGVWSPKYLIGPGSDAAYPGGAERCWSDHGPIATNLIAFSALVRRIRASAWSVEDLAIDSGLAPATVRSALARMKAAGLARIGAWRRRESGVGGCPTALWVWGPGEDTARPVPFTNAERMRRSQIRRKASAQSASDLPANGRSDAGVRAILAAGRIAAPALAEMIGCDLQDLSTIMAPSVSAGHVRVSRFEAMSVWELADEHAYAVSRVEIKRMPGGVTRVLSDREAL